jgi:hypothetical protein
MALSESGMISSQSIPSVLPGLESGQIAETKIVPSVPGCRAVSLHEVKHFYKQNSPGTGRTVRTGSQIKGLHEQRDGTAVEQEREPTSSADILSTDYSICGILNNDVGS